MPPRSPPNPSARSSSSQLSSLTAHSPSLTPRPSPPPSLPSFRGPHPESSSNQHARGTLPPRSPDHGRLPSSRRLQPGSSTPINLSPPGHPDLPTVPSPPHPSSLLPPTAALRATPPRSVIPPSFRGPHPESSSTQRARGTLPPRQPRTPSARSSRNALKNPGGCGGAYAHG